MLETSLELHMTVHPANLMCLEQFAKLKTISKPNLYENIPSYQSKNTMHMD